MSLVINLSGHPWTRHVLVPRLRDSQEGHGRRSAAHTGKNHTISLPETTNFVKVKLEKFTGQCAKAAAEGRRAPDDIPAQHGDHRVERGHPRGNAILLDGDVLGKARDKGGKVSFKIVTNYGGT